MSWTPSYRSTVLSSPSVTLEAPDFFSPSYHLVQYLEEISVRMNNMLKAVQILGCCSFGLVWRRRNSGGPSFISVSAKPLSYSSSSRRSTGRNSLFLAEFPARRSRYLRAFHASAACSESNPDGASSVAFHSSAGNIRKINFCQWCGGPTKHEIPHGEEKMRAICTVCRKIAYQNPKMVVGCLVEHEKKVLLCKRKIQPSYGLWTLPAGYMEMGESAVEGAIRETWEEANAEVEMLSPFAQLDIPLIGQTYIIFLAKLKKMQFSPGPESLECQLFALDAIPFNSLAFSSMLVTLNLYIEDVKAGKPKFHYCTINKRPGTSSSDIRAFTLDNHLQS